MAGLEGTVIEAEGLLRVAVAIEAMRENERLLRDRADVLPLANALPGAAPPRAVADRIKLAIDTDGFENKAICCAYVPADGKEVTVPRLRNELTNAIPRYMLPTHWLSFDELPKNANGKIHRPQLRETFAAQHNAPIEKPPAEDGQVAAKVDSTL